MKKLGLTFMYAISVALLYATDPLPNSLGLTLGKADLQSAGAMTFGPEGILFVAEPRGPQSSPST
jgi:hypothetical protein